MYPILHPNPEAPPPGIGRRKEAESNYLLPPAPALVYAVELSVGPSPGRGWPARQVLHEGMLVESLELQKQKSLLRRGLISGALKYQDRGLFSVMEGSCLWRTEVPGQGPPPRWWSLGF